MAHRTQRNIYLHLAVYYVLSPILCDPHGLSPAKLLCPFRFSRQEYWSGLPCPLPGDLPNPGFEPRSPICQVDSLLTEPPGKPKNIEVGSLSLLQGIFLTHRSNQDLLRCRQTLYQPDSQGSAINLWSLVTGLHLQSFLFP